LTSAPTPPINATPPFPPPLKIKREDATFCDVASSRFLVFSFLAAFSVLADFTVLTVFATFSVAPPCATAH